MNSQAGAVPNPMYTPIAATSAAQHPVYPPRSYLDHVQANVLGETDPLMETDANYMPQPGVLDSAERRLGAIANAAYTAAQHRVQPPLMPAQCQDSCLPAAFETQWQEQFIGFPSIQIDRECRMYQKDPRTWQADLNSLRYERGVALDAEWSPYRHMNARQSWVQFLSTDFQSRRDQTMRPINSFEDAYCVKADLRYGEGNRRYPVSCITKPVSNQSM